ncbi:MAG: VWA domain-containing protein [Pseudomonadota bacterium]
MARRKRQFNVFNLSFLDIMSCGFGAVILFFVIINHAQDERNDDLTADLSGEVNLVETELKLEKLNLAKLQNALTEIEEEIITAQGASDRLLQEVTESEDELSDQNADTAARREHLNQLITDLKKLEEERERLKQLETEGGKAVRSFVGQGDRQYLTGLRVGGRRVAIFLDASASMLDDTLVNVIRRRNLPDDQKRRADKWQRAIRTVDWITTQIPPESKFQIYTFNTETKPAIEGTEGQWLDVGEGRDLDRAVAALRDIVPQNGTRLHAVTEALFKMDPLPDNVFLLVDGLPTQGRTPPTRKAVVSSRDRERFFYDATGDLPLGVPVNTILFPMEGDPKAASGFWRLAIITGGSFITPSRDWP